LLMAAFWNATLICDAFMRRSRDLIYQHETDLGGVDSLSEGQRAIVRRVAMLQVQLEALERKFAENEGTASRWDLEAYQRASNSMRRLLESLGLNKGRVPRDITQQDEQEDEELREAILNVWADDDAARKEAASP